MMRRNPYQNHPFFLEFRLLLEWKICDSDHSSFSRFSLIVLEGDLQQGAEQGTHRDESDDRWSMGYISPF